MSRLLVQAIAVVCLALLFPQIGRAADFKTLPAPEGSDGQYYNAISPDGRFVVGDAFWHDPISYESRHEGVLWDLRGGMRLLGNISPRMVANDGVKVIGHVYESSSQGYMSQWTPTGGIERIGGYAVDPYEWSVTSMSADGKTLVGIRNDFPQSDAFRWTEDEGFTSAGLGGHCSSVSTSQLSPNGEFAAAGIEHRCVSSASLSIWGPSGDFEQIDAAQTWPISVADVSNQGTVLSSMAGGAVLSGTGGTRTISTDVYMWAISDLGRTVGQLVYYDETVESAVTWDAVHGVRTISQWLSTEYGLADQLAGWKIESARDISANGRTIIGGGKSHDGQYRNWIATVPEPSSAILAVAGLAAAFVLRRKLAVRCTAPLLLLLCSDSMTRAAEFRPLPIPANTTFDRLIDVSDDGRFVVGIVESNADGAPSSVEQTVVWRRDGSYRTVATSFTPFGIAADGRTISGLYAPDGQLPVPATWTAAAGVRPVAGFELDPTVWQVTDMSDDGRVIVGLKEVDGRFDAFRWSSEQGASLAGIAGYCATVRETVVSDLGQVSALLIEHPCFASAPSSAAKWNAELGVTKLPLYDDPSAYLVDVSDQGTALLRSAWNGYALQSAEEWERVYFNRPMGISADGSMIVGSYYGDWQQAYISSQTSDVTSVASWMNDELGLRDATWNWWLTEAVGVSDDAMTIVGNGLGPNAQPQGWMLIVPEPGSLSLSIVAGASILFALSRRIANRLRKSLVFAMMVAGAHCGALARGAEFQALSAPPGAAEPTVTAVSPDGKIVVGYAYPGAGDLRPWTSIFTAWDADGAARELTRDFYPYKVTNTGKTIGVDRRIIGRELSAQWTLARGMTRFDGLDGDAMDWSVTDMSDDGEVIVGIHRTENGNQPFRWTAASGVSEVHLAGYCSQPSGARLSADGLTTAINVWHDCIGFGLFSGSASAARWNFDGTLLTYEDGFTNPAASAIANDWSASFDSARFLSSSSIWTQHAGKQRIGYRFDASAITPDGSLVVGNDTIDRKDVAMIWSAEHGLRRLDRWLINQFELGDELAGWRLLSADDISADGKTIVGNGINPFGEKQGWRVTVPEPSALGLMVVAGGGLLAVIGRNRRRRSP